MAPEGKKFRIKVRTIHSVYVGDILLPPMRKRVSDVLNDEKWGFMNLTDVRIDNSKEEVEFVCLNKDMIESIILY